MSDVWQRLTIVLKFYTNYTTTTFSTVPWVATSCRTLLDR